MEPSPAASDGDRADVAPATAAAVALWSLMYTPDATNRILPCANGRSRWPLSNRHLCASPLSRQTSTVSPSPTPSAFATHPSQYDAPGTLTHWLLL